MIESCFVIALICLILMGILQVSQMAAAREILYHAAARGARAKTVGFNWWMVEKAMRVAAIPNAGKMTVPDFTNEDYALRSMVATMKPGELWSTLLGIQPSSRQYDVERVRIPEYMASENWPRSKYILDYARWDSIKGQHDDLFVLPNGEYPTMLHISVSQSYSNWVPMHRTFYAADTVGLKGSSHLENHYPLYLEDKNW